jgi:hypothetical protein
VFPGEGYLLLLRHRLCFHRRKRLREGLLLTECSLNVH